MTVRPLVALPLCAMLLAGCAAMPAREPRPEIKLADDYATAHSFTAPPAEWPVDAWWQLYGDRQLDSLIEEALANSPTLAIAEARLRRARANVGVSRSALMPQVSANASATQQKHSYNDVSPREVTPKGWNDYGRATLDVSWELDFWGRNRAAFAAATSESEAAQADAAQARLALSAAVASAYAELAREHAALETAKAARDVRVKTSELFRRRYENGLETLASVRQVESREAATEGEVLALEEQISLQRNLIAALLGAGPDRGLAIERPRISVTHPFGLPDHLAVDLLGRRPDVSAARMRATAAASRIHQAQASFYPNINLTGFIGVQSLGLDLLNESGSSIGSVGPALSLPIFQGGRLRGRLRVADAEYAESVANYDTTVVQALQEVADAATSQKALGPQISRADEAVDAAREAWRIQNNRYQGGLATYLEVLSAEDSLLSSLRSQTDLQSRSLALDVALVRALGGGYSIPR